MHLPFVHGLQNMMLLVAGMIGGESFRKLANGHSQLKPVTTKTQWLYALAVLVIAMQFYHSALPYFRRYPYSDDWEYAYALRLSSVSDWLKWAWAQHVDHRIPIQKLSSFAVLLATGFDFRYLVGLNYLLAIAACGMLLQVARAYRGFLATGDLMIPFAMLGFSTGYSLWGFQFQFASTIFFFALFVCLAFNYSLRRHDGLLLGAAAALLGDALCGINGVLFSTLGTVGVIGWMVCDRTGENRIGTVRNVVPFYVVLALDIFMWLSWQPSSVTSTTASVSTLMTYLFHLIPSSLGVFGFVDTGWKFATVAILFVGASAACVIELAARRLTFQDYVLFLASAASLVVMLSVAVGRSQGPWQWVLGMHYGTMSVFIPACAWIVVSKRLSARTLEIAGLALAGIFLSAFLVNSDWRDGIIKQVDAHQQEVVAAMEAGEDVNVIAAKYCADFTADPKQENGVAEGLETLRANGLPMYGGRRGRN